MEYPGAIYRVIVRGNQRRKIFRDDRDRLYYLKRVEHYRVCGTLDFYSSSIIRLILGQTSPPLARIRSI